MDLLNFKTSYGRSSCLKKMIKLAIVIALISEIFFVACSSDGDNGTGADSVASVQSLDGLGECSTSNEGAVFWVESENKGYICSMGNWLYDAQIINPSTGNSSTQLGTITDARDGQQYKVVVFDGATWLAQNLNYAVANTDSISSKCYMEDPANCATFGRLYSRAAAALPNICPDGFEIVDDVAWNWLKGRYETSMLKSTEGWTYWNDAINPNNATGFGLQASGYCANYNECNALKYEGRYWTLGGDDANEFVAVYYNRNDMERGLKSLSPMDHNAIRCVSKSYGTCSPGNAGEVKSLIGNIYYCDGSQWLDEKYMTSVFTSIYDYPSKELFFNPAINYGSMTDPRDGKTYRTTTISVPVFVEGEVNYVTQVWMAENLNYVTVGGFADDGVGSWCYNNNPQNCDLTGRFYSQTAVKSGALCPAGWHIPIDETNYIMSIPKHSRLDTRKDVYVELDKVDEYGFSAVSAGRYDVEAGLFSEWIDCCFLSEDGPYGGMCGSSVWGDRSMALPVRCVKD